MEKTARGFSMYGDFKDERGCRIRVQESSAVGDPRTWVMITNDAGTYHRTPISGDCSAHLTVDQARQMRDALDRFIADAEDPENWRNSAAYIEAWRDES